MAEQIIKMITKTDSGEEEVIVQHAENANYVLYASPETTHLGTIENRLNELGV